MVGGWGVLFSLAFDVWSGGAPSCFRCAFVCVWALLAVCPFFVVLFVILYWVVPGRRCGVHLFGFVGFLMVCGWLLVAALRLVAGGFFGPSFAFCGLVLPFVVVEWGLLVGLVCWRSGSGFLWSFFCFWSPCRLFVCVSVARPSVSCLFVLAVFCFLFCPSALWRVLRLAFVLSCCAVGGRFPFIARFLASPWGFFL